MSRAGGTRDDDRYTEQIGTKFVYCNHIRALRVKLHKALTQTNAVNMCIVLGELQQ